MDAQTIQTIKEKLSVEKRRLESELNAMGHRLNDSGEMQPDFAQFGAKEDENAAEVAMFSDNLSLEETLQRELRDVEKALERIERGEYGICKYCKKPIATNRLLARPESSSCVECKEQLSK